VYVMIINIFNIYFEILIKMCQPYKTFFT